MNSRQEAIQMGVLQNKLPLCYRVLNGCQCLYVVPRENLFYLHQWNHSNSINTVMTHQGKGDYKKISNSLLYYKYYFNINVLLYYKCTTIFPVFISTTIISYLFLTIFTKKNLYLK